MNRVLEPLRDAALRRQRLRVQSADRVFTRETLDFGVGQLRQRGAHPIDPLAAQLQRRQVGLGEVAVVLGAFLAALHYRAPPVLVPAHGHLLYRAAAIKQRRLAGHLVGDGVAYCLERIEVLDLDLDAVFAAGGLVGGAQAQVDLTTHGALFHVARVDAQVTQDRTQLDQIAIGFVGAAQVRFGDDLHQRHAGPVQIHQADPVRMNRLAGVFFQMRPADADAPRLTVVAVNDQKAVVAERQLVLADLIPLGQVRVAVVLAGEDAERGDLAMERQPAAHGLLDGVLVDDRQHAGHGQTHGTDMAVGRCFPVIRAARAEHLGRGLELRVDFHADDGQVGPGCDNG